MNLHFGKGFAPAHRFCVVAVPFAMLLALWRRMRVSICAVDWVFFARYRGGGTVCGFATYVGERGIGLILIAALAVNLRMAMYSASLVPHLALLRFGSGLWSPM